MRFAHNIIFLLLIAMGVLLVGILCRGHIGSIYETTEYRVIKDTK